MKIFFLVLFIYSSACFAQVETLGTKSARLQQPSFYHDILNFASTDTSQTRVDVFVQVPYPEIKFVKTDTGFIANYTVTVSIFDEKKEKLALEKLWSAKVEASDYTQTVLRNNYDLSLKSFNLKPDKYFFRVAVEDNESKKIYLAENSFIVRNLNKKSALSDFIIVSSQSSVAGANKITPNISRNVATQKNGLPLFYELYSDSTLNEQINYVILNKNKDTVFSANEKRSVKKGRNQIFYTIKAEALPMGEYTVYVSVKNEKGETLDNVGKNFVSQWTGVPTNIKDLDKAIEQLIYIAKGSELKYIKEGKDNTEKAKRFMEFWKKKDPSPATEENELFNEYYGRIAFANEKFTRYTEGWRTDMGMVYIILGPPTNVDRHPFDYNSKPYEIWQYYELSKQYIFVDYNGFGDYRLITPLTDTDYRFRN